MSTQYPKLQFEILSPDEIRALSVAQVTHSDPQCDHWNGGLMDPRMGPTNFSSEGPEESSADCRTCGSSLLECAGHFGHIELAEWVFHPGFIRKVKKVLQCVCVKCGRLKMHQNSRLIETLSAIEDPKKRMDLVWTECQKELVCGSNLAEDWEEGTSREESGCGHIHPVIKRRALGIFLQNLDCPHQKLPVVSRRITAAWAHVILARISNDDLQILGFSHLRISADTCSRGSQGGDDGLTYKLREILKCSKSLQANEDERELQYYVASYLDSDFPGLSRVTDRRHDVDCLSSRVKCRVRQSLLGRSADFSARTCVTIDPDIAMDEVGVPKSIAMTLTYPERVTHYNISLLQTLVSNGAGTYPGARCVIDDSDKFMDLSTRTQGEFTLQYGWVVERHLRDGDFVLLSSENCSQRSNAMGHRVRVMPWSTFRLNPSIILGYGVRSGENMIIRVPRSEESRAELSEIMYVPRQMISPHNGKPAVGLSQEVCWGLRTLTSKDTFLDLEQIQNVLFHFPGWDGVLPTPAIVKPKCFWTGKQVVGVLLPRTTNYIYTRTDEYQPHIEKGELISGVFPNNDYFQLVNVLVRQAGAEAACRKESTLVSLSRI
ncbi:DNA-directed RNA polymerase II core subunit rpo21 [Stygiomarasmius scandens]|uniref:DNA-directed RNA polymerase subunit n=1 Tax=Marasmiellus scandens TaxID=2682957 RepID=A0ABR1J6U8_9AGAR